jgi:hypothetical protein
MVISNLQSLLIKDNSLEVNSYVFVEFNKHYATQQDELRSSCNKIYHSHLGYTNPVTKIVSLNYIRTMEHMTRLHTHGRPLAGKYYVDTYLIFCGNLILQYLYTKNNSKHSEKCV